MREPADYLSFFRALEEKPYQYDFFQALRRIECLFPKLPRIGQALRPADEPVRLGQEPALSFAPSTITSFKLADGAALPRMEVRFFGMLGPNGPLPLHLTELARGRAIHAGDQTLVRFLDLFHQSVSIGRARTASPFIPDHCLVWVKRACASAMP